ncbi:transglycosylase SLT domain-containing protein [Streptomyces sp. NPDC029080]|uniref:transglycosylase SLT domain-containing protein n=1 Tax=Streptomyces sp. NPDC029080 TaxID=3155017 RepID=UPI00340E1C73
MAATGRGPIKVGSGYIEINPRLSEEAVKKFRAEITREMEKAGQAAGKEFTAATTEGLVGLPKEVKKIAAKAAQAVEGEAKDSAETIAKIEADLTKQFGEQATKRFREARKLEERKRVLVEETSAATQAALKATLRAETEAGTLAAKTQQQQLARKEKAQAEYEKYVRDSNDRIAKQEAADIAASRKLVQEAEAAKVKATQEASKARQKALEDEARMDREIHTTQERLAREAAAAEVKAQRERQAAIRETLLARQNEQRTFIQTQLQETAAYKAGLTEQLAALRTHLAEVQAAQGAGLTAFRKRLGKVSEATEKFGTNATELGGLITHKIIAPMGIAAGAATAFGVKSADAMLQAQKGLEGMHLELKDVNSLLEQMTKYGIATPYSVNDMLTYGTRYARANAAHNKDFNSDDPLKHAKGSREVSQRSVDMVKMVGDSAAFGGILDPTMVSQGMYALEVIQDMGRVNLRNMKQLERATGIPAEALAQMMGFQDRAYSKKELAEKQKQDEANGVKRKIPTEYSASAQLMDFMANAKETGGVSGEQLIDALLQHWNDPKTGVKGAAARMGSATISGRLEMMKENAQYKLGQLFYTKDEKTGKYKYSGLGESIMGKQVKDKNGTHFEGGLINDVQDIGKDLFPTLKKLLKAFIDGLTTFVGWIKWAAKFLKDHPWITDLVLTVSKFAAGMAPVLLGLGVLSKILGKSGKVLGAGLAPVKGAYKAVRGTVRVGRQVAAGASEWAQGGKFRDGYKAKRDEFRDRNDGGVSRTMRQMADLEEQTKQAEQRAAALREQLREVNSQDLNRIARAIAGGGGGGAGQSIAAAAQQARQAVQHVVSEGLEPLNRTNLNQVDQEIDKVRQSTEKLITELKNGQTEVTQLDGKKLVQLKVTVDGAHGTVTDLKNKIDDTAHSVVVLDGKKLEALKAQFNHVHDAAEKGFTKIGQGTGAGSLAGRVGLLNGRSLNGIKSQFNHVTDAADKAFAKIGQGTGGGSLAGRVGLLNGRSLKDIRGQFDKLTTAADDAYKKVGQGTGAGSLAGRIGLLNGRSLSDIKVQVDHLKDSLDAAHTAANHLNTSLDNIAEHKSGGSSSGKGGKGKTRKPYTGGVITSQGNLAHFATGGVLPGYMPGIDSIPAILSPGEAILRPEVTAALGAPLIHHWNAMARKGMLSRFAGGGIVGRFGVDKIIDMIHNQNIWPDASAAISTMAFDATSVPLGGDIQSGMLGAGKGAGNFIGSDVATKFDGIYNFVTDDAWKFLKRLPTVVGQVIGIIGGAFAPQLGDYFHDDVWKGNGNILDRGERFLGDVFSTKTLTSAFDNLFGGLWDSVKSIVGGAKDLITDPVGSVTKTIDALWDVGTGEINQIVDMVKAVKSFAESPKDYAMTVLGDVYETGKEALPNTKGLFDFSKDDKVNAKKPSDIAEKYSIEDPPGSGVQRWKPSVQRVLKELGLSLSYTDLVLHRIQVESGGNPSAINTWDSNAKAGYPSQGLLQTIPQTFNAYAGPYKKLGMYNGLASIYAGLNYAVHRYGSGWPKALSGTKGYWTGTNSASPGIALVGERGPELIDFSGGERVYNNRDTTDLLSGKKYEIHIHEAKSEDTTQSVLRAMQYAEALYGGL